MEEEDDGDGDEFEDGDDMDEEDEYGIDGDIGNSGGGGRRNHHNGDGDMLSDRGSQNGSDDELINTN